MKNKMLLLALLATISILACSSEKKNDTAAQSAVATTCPTFDGIYSQKIDAENSRSIEIHTKQEAGFFHYSFGRDTRFLKADGLELDLLEEGKEGKIKVSCNQSTVTVEAEELDQAHTKLVYSITEANRFKLTTSGGDLAPMNGIYTKE